MHSHGQLTPDLIKKNYKFLKFENILQYVALPNLPIVEEEVKESASQTTPEGAKKQVNGTEPPANAPDHSQNKSEEVKRQEKATPQKPKPAQHKMIFDWLRNIKNVEQVLHIIVEDDLDNPHDDETIISAVSHLQVETWDWRKYDLCSDTIFKAAPNVTRVNLYTTGNNTVLRGWSDENGLRVLKKVNSFHTLPMIRILLKF